MNKFILIVLVSSIPTGWAMAGYPEKQVNGSIPQGSFLGRFATLNGCIEKMRQEGGELQIALDTPRKVLGKFQDGRIFWCTRYITGTQGTFYQGGYG